MSSRNKHIAFIGFGEAAQAFASGFRSDDPGIVISAFDKKTDGPEGGAKRKEYQSAGIEGRNSAAELSDGVEVIFSMVTADQAEIAADNISRGHLNNCLYLDCNSCAPETKKRAAKLIEAAGGRYVDVAIMTPVHPKLSKAPCLLAGPHTDTALEVTQKLGMVTEIAGNATGDASMRKMVRSVMIKGLEALTLECFLAAHKAGIEDNLLESLEASFPGFDWHQRAPYMIERAMTHGIRRAAEMKEVAKTLRDLNVWSDMTEATTIHQFNTGKLALDANKLGPGNLSALTEAILNAETPAEKAYPRRSDSWA